MLASIAEYGTTVGKVREVVCGHIHSSALADDGRLWAWGCGSNDGRCGVERFLNRAGENRPPEVDTLKCYMMGPHRVGCARPRYWPHGPSLDGVRVIAVATGRNHMAAIGVGGGPPAAYCHSTYRARDVDEKVVAPVGDAARARGATVVHEYDGPSDGVYESIWTRSNDYPPCAAAAPALPTPTLCPLAPTARLPRPLHRYGSPSGCRSPVGSRPSSPGVSFSKQSPRLSSPSGSRGASYAAAIADGFDEWAGMRSSAVADGIAEE